MMRIRSLRIVFVSLALVGTAGLVHAADDVILAKHIRGWGKIIDPKGDCSVEEKEGTVSMTVVGRHDLSIELGLGMNGPRVMREIDGDFIAMVKVDGAFGAAGPSTVASRRPYMGAGLLLWQDEKNYVRLEHASVDVDGTTYDYLSFEERKQGEINIAYNQIALKSGPVRLRMERRNGKLCASAAYDAPQWAGYPPFQIAMPAKVQLGVAAVSTSSVPFVPEFSEFEVYRRENSTAPRTEKE